MVIYSSSDANEYNPHIIFNYKLIRAL